MRLLLLIVALLSMSVNAYAVERECMCPCMCSSKDAVYVQCKPYMVPSKIKPKVNKLPLQDEKKIHASSYDQPVIYPGVKNNKPKDMTDASVPANVSNESKKSEDTSVKTVVTDSKVDKIKQPHVKKTKNKSKKDMPEKNTIGDDSRYAPVDMSQAATMMYKSKKSKETTTTAVPANKTEIPKETKKTYSDLPSGWEEPTVVPEGAIRLEDIKSPYTESKSKEKAKVKKKSTKKSGKYAH